MVQTRMVGDSGGRYLQVGGGGGGGVCVGKQEANDRILDVFCFFVNSVITIGGGGSSVAASSVPAG